MTALQKLEYIPYYKIYTNTMTDENYDDFSAPDLYINELAIFVRIFGKLFK